MSFLEDMAGKEVSSMLANSSNPLAASVMQMINSQPGGLSGLVQQFHDKGLGGLVSSWVGTGQNLPISADQLQHVLGSEQVKELAAKAGISPDMRDLTPVPAAPHVDRQNYTQWTGSPGWLVASSKKAWGCSRIWASERPAPTPRQSRWPEIPLRPLRYLSALCG